MRYRYNLIDLTVFYLINKHIYNCCYTDFAFHFKFDQMIKQ